MEEKNISITRKQLLEVLAESAIELMKETGNPLLILQGKLFADELSKRLFEAEVTDEKQTETDELASKKEPKYKLSHFEFENLKRLKESGAFWIYRDKEGSIHTLCRPEKRVGCGDYKTAETCIYYEGWDVNTISKNDFLFLDFEKDEEATLIDDILNDCEVVDNE